MYKTLSYLSMKDFKWVIHSNQINNCPVMIQDIDVAMKIWGKNIAALKGKTTRSKTHSVARDYVKVPKELLKLHKEVFLTTDIFLLNKIPFLLTMFYSCQPPRGQNCPADIQGFQGDVPILSTTWFPHHNGTC
jgi:hypothetical protein